MKRRPLAALGLLLLWSAAYAAGPAVKPWTPGTGQPAAPADSQAPRKPVSYVDGVRDSGQFLPDSDVLGSVDERQFTVWEFRQYWFASYAQDRPAVDSAGRFDFLNSMVNKEVLARLARQVNRPLTFEDRTQLREHSERVLSNATYQKLVADSAVASESDLRHAYEQTRFQLHLKQLVAADRATAERARAELLAGRIAWPAAVKRYSIAQQAKGPDGDVGWVQRAAFDPRAAVEIFDLGDGQVSRVYADPQGFRILLVVERRPVTALPFERIRPLLVEALQPIKIEQRVEEVRARLRQRLGMVYDSTNIAWSAAVFGRNPGVQRDDQGNPILDLAGILPEFSPADTSRQLATWSEGRLTLGAFLDEYRSFPALSRPKVDDFAGFRWVLDGFVLEPYMAQLAAERGYEKDPLVVAQIEKKREQIMVEHLFQDSVASRVWITPAERQEYYRSRLKNFWSFQSVRFAAVARDSKAGADSVAERLRKGEKAESVLRADSLAGLISGSIRSMREDDRGAYYKLLFEEMRPGDIRVRGPDKVGGYVVIQKLEHDGGRQLSYDEVQAVVDESLQNIKAERLLKDLIARHRVEHTVVLHPERLMRVRLTDPLSD